MKRLVLSSLAALVLMSGCTSLWMVTNKAVDKRKTDIEPASDLEAAAWEPVPFPRFLIDDNEGQWLAGDHDASNLRFHTTKNLAGNQVVNMESRGITPLTDGYSRVNFYDGIVIQSYSKDDFLQVTIKDHSIQYTNGNAGGREYAMYHNLLIRELEGGAFEFSVIPFTGKDSIYNTGHFEYFDTFSADGSVLSAVPVSGSAGSSESGDGFVFVEGSSFVMGNGNTKYSEADVYPNHLVTLDDFYISPYEVTQKEWLEVMGRSLRQQRDLYDSEGNLHGEGPQYPIYYVRWEDALEYCNELSLREGLTPCYSGEGDNIRCDFTADGYRLPTESEWEYASRGGVLNDAPSATGFNNKYFLNLGWLERNSDESAHPVGGKAADSLGLYDMCGNVYEWCWDLYADRYPSGPQVNPAGPDSGDKRVYRGSSYSDGVAHHYKDGRMQGYYTDRGSMDVSWYKWWNNGREIGLRLVRTAVD